MTPELEVRPWRARWVAAVLAVVLVVTFVTVGALLRRSDTGVYFQLADQLAMGLIGVLLAGAALLFTRPRLCADASGVHIRNVIGSQRLPWALVRRVSFPDGSPWARIDLPDDEYVPVMAIQATDGARAVEAIRALRALHSRYAAPPSVPTTDSDVPT